MLRPYLVLLIAAALMGPQADVQAAPPDPWLDSLAALAAAIPEQLPPFAAPTPSPIPSPTPTPIVPQPPADLDAVRASPPLFGDDFGEDSGHWSPDAAGVVDCSWLDGAYVMAAGRNLRGACMSDVETADFLYEVNAAYLNGAEYGFAAGLVFRAVDEQNYYRFEAQADGRYTLIKVVDGETTVLVEPVESVLLHTGGEFQNRLGVLAVGADLTLLANGSALQTVQDTSLNQGRLGLYVRAPQQSCIGFDCILVTGIAIAFDTLRVWPVDALPPPPVLTPTPTVQPDPPVLTIESLPIDWQPLVEEFEVTHPRLEEVLEATMALPVTFVVFEFEAVRDVGQVAYSAAFINDQHKVKSVSSVEFRPDPGLPFSLYDTLGGWRAGVRGTARFALPGDVSKYVTIRLVRGQ